MKRTHDKAAMISAIKHGIEETAHLTGVNRLDDVIIKALLDVPRHKFIPAPYDQTAYLNTPMPIGFKQTISQPYIVALMTQLLKPNPKQRILEVGTGSGYQAAILSRMVKQLYSIEIIESLATQAAKTLQQLEYHNIEIKQGDGCLGWPEHAPFDGIIVTAAGEVPQALIEQLAPGGRMVMPIDDSGYSQELITIDKTLQGNLQRQNRLPVRFVPLIS